MKPRMPTAHPIALTLVAAFLLGAGVYALLTAVTTDPSTTTVIKTIPAAPPAVAVDGPDKDTLADDALALNHVAQDVLEDATRAPERFDVGDDLRGTDPTQSGVLEGPLAAQEWPGCRTHFVRNFSSRRGARIKAIWLHYTGSINNQPGWSFNNALTAYANNPSSQVSWHFLIDREGHCTYTVPLQYKAWTQGNANRESIGIEVEGNGYTATQPTYAGTAGARRLRAVVRRISRIYHIPIRLGAVNDCQITRSGLLTHWMGGACSGGHIDIRPYDIARVARYLATNPCSTRCQRRKRHTATHERLRELHCRTASRRARHPGACATLYRRNRALHAAGI